MKYTSKKKPYKLGSEAAYDEVEATANGNFLGVIDISTDNIDSKEKIQQCFDSAKQILLASTFDKEEAAKFIKSAKSMKLFGVEDFGDLSLKAAVQYIYAKAELVMHRQIEK